MAFFDPIGWCFWQIHVARCVPNYINMFWWCSLLLLSGFSAEKKSQDTSDTPGLAQNGIFWPNRVMFSTNTRCQMCSKPCKYVLVMFPINFEWLLSRKKSPRTHLTPLGFHVLAIFHHDTTRFFFKYIREQCFYHRTQLLSTKKQPFFSPNKKISFSRTHLTPLGKIPFSQ